MENRQTVALGNVILGEGIPKVCVSVMGKNAQEIGIAAKAAVQAGAQIIELRADSLMTFPSVPLCTECVAAIRENAPGVPVIFTLRTVRDGGEGTDNVLGYEALTLAMAYVCDAVDAELSCGERSFSRIVRSAHEAGAKVIGSSHLFTVPENMDIAAQWLLRQQELGVDICKAAVMTKNRVQALEAALCMAKAGEQLTRPYIAIAMGKSGMLTRAAAACVGSCLSFGSVGKASAPGQMEAGTLRDVLLAIGEI